MISVLLPVYNGERYLRESLDSVLSQEFEDFELLIGFNGTIDGSKDIAYSYTDDRIRIYDYKNEIGKARTLNKLIQNSKYEYIALQDDDDIWLKDKLKKQSVVISEYDVVGTQILYIDKNSNKIKEIYLATDDFSIKKKSLSGVNQMANTSVVLKKNAALSVSGWRENIDGIEDYDMWLRLMRIGKTFKNLSDNLVYHRIHAASNFNTKSYDLKTILSL